MKTYLEFINEDYRGSQKNPADIINSGYCIYYNNKDFSEYWSNMPTDWLDMYQKKYFYKKAPALKYLIDLSKTNIKEAFLTKMKKDNPKSPSGYYPNYEYMLEKWWDNHNNEKMGYWEQRALDDPYLYEKYLFGLENVGKNILSKLDFKQIEFIKNYLLNKENYKYIWDEIIKHCPKLDTGAEMGNLGF